MSCRDCKPYDVPVLYELDFAMGMSSGQIVIDPARLGQKGSDNSSVFGLATHILWIGINSDNGAVVEFFVTRSETTWASGHLDNTHGIFMHLHFSNFDKFIIFLSSTANDEIKLTVVVRIDPLKEGASCACGRKNESN